MSGVHSGAPSVSTHRISKSQGSLSTLEPFAAQREIPAAIGATGGVPRGTDVRLAHAVAAVLTLRAVSVSDTVDAQTRARSHRVARTPGSPCPNRSAADTPRSRNRRRYSRRRGSTGRSSLRSVRRPDPLDNRRCSRSGCAERTFARCTRRPPAVLGAKALHASPRSRVADSGAAPVLGRTALGLVLAVVTGARQETAATNIPNERSHRPSFATPGTYQGNHP